MSQTCCDDLEAILEVPAVVPHPCCRHISVYQRPTLQCEIYGVVVTGAGGGIPYQTTPITLPDSTNPQPISTVCPNPGETRVITVEFLDFDGNVLCRKTVLVSCPSGNDCCDRIGISITRPLVVPQPCCRRVSIYRMPGLDCDIYGVNVNGNSAIPLQTTPITLLGMANPTTVFTACPGPGASTTYTIDFLDQNGNVICTKTVTLSCSDEEFYGKAGTGEMQGGDIYLRSYPNPATGETVISYELASETTVRIELFDPVGKLVGVIDQGRKAQGPQQIAYNVGGLPQGMYMVRLTTPAGVVSLPLVISAK